MFIKLRWAYTKDPVVFNTDHISHFSRGSGWTILHTTDGRAHEVHEKPDEILVLLEKPR